MTYKVKVENVSKIYDMNRSRKDKLLSLFTFGYFYKEKPFYALRDISFEVEAGDSVGIVGLNGSGKSTLSDLLGEATVPNEGKITINGTSSMIAINAGLDQELTGVENIKKKCLMHGLSEKQIEERYDDILEFSELDDFINQPIKSYSSGMKSRLGFAIAIHTDPDVLIVDEALSVGDETFSNKCLEKIKQFQKEGKTIFFVSHSAKQIGKMCNKAMWIHYGELKDFGKCVPIANEYARFINKFKAMTKAEQLNYKKEMIEKQQERSSDIKIKKYRRPLYKYIPILSLLGVFVYSILLQLNLI